MSILVVGSVAFDSVETPLGKAERVLGGSASFFSVAASFFVPVNLVAVVGTDFGEKELAAFAGRTIDLEGLERAGVGTAGSREHHPHHFGLDSKRIAVAVGPETLQQLQKCRLHQIGDSCCGNIIHCGLPLLLVLVDSKG